METFAFMPGVASAAKVHREIDMSAQGLETGGVKRSDRTHVAGYRPDRQVLIAASGSLGHYPFMRAVPALPYRSWGSTGVRPAVGQGLERT